MSEWKVTFARINQKTVIVEAGTEMQAWLKAKCERLEKIDRKELNVISTERIKE